MKKILLYFLVSTLLLFYSCSKDELPKSIKIINNRVYFTLKDKNYKEVFLGTDLIGNWKNLPMKKVDTTWIISFFNPHKEVQYKFWINRIYWLRDNLNKSKIALKAPYQGYNSIVVLK